jgi:hypothetical protein
MLNVHLSNDVPVASTIIRNNEIEIQNQYLSRKYQIRDHHIYTQEIQNKRCNTSLIPLAGSEDFILLTHNRAKETTRISSSELTFMRACSEPFHHGVKLFIHYAPYTVTNIEYQLTQVVTLKDEEPFARSYLQISATVPDSISIDYIDIDRFILPENTENVWSHPDESNISSMYIGAHELMLGQPIYVNGLFLGSEFPAADTRISNHTTEIRYYSGKTLAQLGNNYQTWPNVIGAASGTHLALVQSDFFAYIEHIATPTKFRKQYNSWYDNMMDITDESIFSSFLSAEAGLTRNGVPPLDSYVVDDGWNNYYDGTFTSSAGSSQGSTKNRTGFWEFNDKFPNELYPSSALTSKLQSSFGLWLGPQGGYQYHPTFAKYLESKGTGHVQNDYWMNVCVGSDKYIKNLERLFIDYQKRFQIDYWKWDGFAIRPCTCDTHDHMTGGYQNMYFTTDLWEKWIALFRNVRNARTLDGHDLFINATCYINLSPWLLQWVNTVWIQDSDDTGEMGTGARHQQKIYYRDQVYYQMLNQNQLQFPLKNIYNHDPIFGVSDGSTATTEVFREYLFANAVRGTAFWELYYSPSIMDDDKWKATADVLRWAEDNHETLKHAKLFGNEPKTGVYGYASWNGNKGIISFTNPCNEAQTYSLKISEVIGADPSLSNLPGIQILPYSEKVKNLPAVSYGDTITVDLLEHQTIILQYGFANHMTYPLTNAQVKEDGFLWDFTITATLKTASSDVVLTNIGDDVVLSITKDGFVSFTVCNHTITSEETVIHVVEKAHGTFGTADYVPTSTKATTIGTINDNVLHSITALRECNGMLKLYLDGKLVSSFYEKNGQIKPLRYEAFQQNKRNLHDTFHAELLNTAIPYNQIQEEYTNCFCSRDLKN